MAEVYSPSDANARMDFDIGSTHGIDGYARGRVMSYAAATTTGKAARITGLPGSGGLGGGGLCR